eukprot:TRINITY_DN3180_c0_g1_i1.p1 TRINITY_DN3180_c0_g1~~TRINITY_DN3180_c0_g1_i1.p1  ORF type:complete len:593 (+),score=149.12 TRINITY_DN3180_c0_g1_i1:61-1839(+)
MTAKIYPLLVLLALCLVRVDGSCFGTDASWNPGSKPIVSQPSKNDPAKVMVDWTSIIKNSKCVDKYFLWIWPDGTQKTSSTTQKIQIAKGTTSKIVEVEPCVAYRFFVELEETEMRSINKLTSETLFKSAAIAKVINLDKTKFSVGYHWDPVKQVSDLRMASISFPKSLVQYPSCLDYVQVSGAEVRAKKSLSRQSSTASMDGAVAWGHLGKTYNPSISVGSANTLPSGISFAGGSSSPSMSRGSSPPRGPLAGTYSTGSTGSLQSQRSTSPAGGSPFGPIEKPVYANTLPRATSKGATQKSGPVKVQPPFLKPMIEILIAAKDCAEFNFEVKLYGPSSKELGKVQNIHMPALADIPSYIPPPITQVMSISFGTSGKPVYGVKTSSGVSAACLPSYFEALDAYRQRLENEVGFHAAKAGVSQGKVAQTNQQSEVAQEQTLKTQGCICTSPHLEFSTTDAKLQKSHLQDFGHYHFKGLHGGHPYYEKMAHNHAGAHSHSGHGHTGSQNTQTVTTPTPTTAQKTMFLFYEDKMKQWVFGPTLGAIKGVDFGSAEKTLAKCPADPPASGTWQRKSSILGRWKKDTTLKVACETNL